MYLCIHSTYIMMSNPLSIRCSRLNICAFAEFFKFCTQLAPLKCICLRLAYEYSKFHPQNC